MELLNVTETLCLSYFASHAIEMYTTISAVQVIVFKINIHKNLRILPTF